MKKQKYNAPELCVVIFDDDKVITASTPNDTPDRKDPVELPFVPFN